MLNYVLQYVNTILCSGLAFCIEGILVFWKSVLLCYCTLSYAKDKNGARSVITKMLWSLHISHLEYQNTPYESFDILVHVSITQTTVQYPEINQL